MNTSQWGSFAGGLASGIQAGIQLAQKNEELQLKREQYAKENELATKKAEQEAMVRQNKTLSEAGKINMEYANKVREVKANKNLTAKEKADILNQEAQSRSSSLNMLTKGQDASTVNAIGKSVKDTGYMTYGSGIDNKNREYYTDIQTQNIIDELDVSEQKTLRFADDGNVFKKVTLPKGDTDEVLIGKVSYSKVDEDKTKSLIGYTADGKEVAFTNNIDYNKAINSGSITKNNPIGSSSVDATYNMKFNIAKKKIKKENPDMDETELNVQAMDYVKNTANERTTKRIENKKKALQKEFNVDSIIDINILKERKNIKTAVKLDNLFNDIAKDIFSNTWQSEVKKASEAVTNVDKLFKASVPYTKDVSDEKLSNTNFLKRMYDNTIGNYLGDNATSEEKRVAAKYLSSIMNVVRNEQFGAVVPAAEATKFNDAATSLYQTSPNILIGIESMLKDQVYKMEEAKSVIGEELFYLKYGDRINKIKNRIDGIENIRKGNNKEDNPTYTKEQVSNMSEKEKKELIRKTLKGLK